MKLYQNEAVKGKEKGLVLQPIGDMENVERTILQGVCLDDLSDVLTEVQNELLEKSFPSGEFIIWGVDDQNKTNENYQLIEEGFDVWFYKERCYFLRAKVVCKFHSPKVASILWDPAKDGRNYNNLYFCSVESLLDIKVPVSKVNEVLLEEAKESPLRSMRVCSGENARALLELL